MSVQALHSHRISILAVAAAASGAPVDDTRAPGHQLRWRWRPQKLKNVTLVLHYDPPNSLKQYIHRQTGHGMVKPTSFVFIQEGSALFRELKARKIDVDELNWFDLY